MLRFYVPRSAESEVAAVDVASSDTLVEFSMQLTAWQTWQTALQAG